MTFCDGCLTQSTMKCVQMFIDGNGRLSFDLCEACQQRLSRELPKLIGSFRPDEIRSHAGLTPDQAAKVKAYYEK